jgi:hypothetical protein
MLLVAVSLTAVLIVALPALRELARAARSAEKLFDTLSRELPPTLEAIRLTGMEITDLTDDVSDGVQNASRVVQQVDQSLKGVRRQAKKAQISTRSIVVGFKAAWRTLTRPSGSSQRRSVDRLSASDSNSFEFDRSYETVYEQSETLLYENSAHEQGYESYEQEYVDQNEVFDDDEESSLNDEELKAEKHFRKR